MLTSMMKTLRWCLSLGAKFSRVVPGRTLIIVILTLVSLFATLIASVLPLKVVILLGAEQIPGYFPETLARMGRDVLILILSAATVSFFLLHLFVDQLIGWVTNSATALLLNKSQKMVLFENQQEVAGGAYQRFSRALASAVFLGLAMGGLVLLYPAMAVVALGYSLVVLLSLWLMYSINMSMRERIDTKLMAMLNVVAMFGFFGAFGFLVIDFIFWSPPGVLIAIISLLLIRQVMNRAASLCGDLSILKKQQVKLDALFFHGKTLLPTQVKANNGIWPLLQTQDRYKWIAMVLDEMDEKQTGKLEIQWHQSGMPDVAMLGVATPNNSYLFKLFDVNRSTLALHEATLMAESLRGLPAPEFVGTTQVNRFHCLAYRLPLGQKVDRIDLKPRSMVVRSALMAVEPSSTLVDLYRRSKPLLWQRLDLIAFDRLKVAADTEQLEMIEKLIRLLPTIKHYLNELPLVLINPDINLDTIWSNDASDSTLILNWWRWSLEPAGAGWPENSQAMKKLRPALKQVAMRRSVIADLRPEHAELAAFAFSFERECNRQRFMNALELLPQLLECMDNEINE